MSDTKTPERIFAEFDKMYPEQNGGAWWGEPCNATEYVRADTAAARLAEVEAERDDALVMLDNAVSKAPEPLKALGEWLADLLDEDDWPTAERLLNAAALTATPATPEVMRVQPDRETFDAMCAMRDAINEYIPMPSLESDLLQGPENSVFCATVAEAVISEVVQLRAALTATPAPVPPEVEALVEAVKAQLAYMDLCNDKGDLERNLRTALRAVEARHE